MTHEEYQNAAEHWRKKDEKNVVLDRTNLLTEMEQYIRDNNTCALATGSGDFIRCTPIEYSYHDGTFWMFSEGGEKFIGLENNKNVCLAIYDKYDGMGNLKGMQVSGVANIVEPFSDDYIAAANYKNIPLDALKQLPDVMNLIQVVPKRIDFLNSQFKKKGYSSRQFIEF